MNKKILVIGGISLILIVVGIWLYLFLSGDTSKTDGAFADFGDSGSAEVFVPWDNTGDDVIAETPAQRLRQLTFRPVAGAAFVETGVLYVEQGTGHVFNINLDTGNETLVSVTTLPKTRSAVFSRDGTFIAITNYIDGVAETIVGSISRTGSLEGVSLPKNASEINFSSNDNEVLYYLTKDSNGSRGYSYDIESAKATELFSIPLRDIRVVWGSDIYVYTTPTSVQEGYLYEVVDNKLNYVTGGNNSLVVFSNPNGLAVTSVTEDSYIQTQIVDVVNDTSVTQPVEFIPEKCVNDPLNSYTIFCAFPTNLTDKSFPDNWYKGVVSYNDVLWEVNLKNGEATSIVNFLTESGREMDVNQIGIDYLGTKLFIINKNDNSLWMFDRTI